MNSAYLEIITLENIVYSGNVVSLTVMTCEGKEGFMAGHTPACKLLPEKSIAEIREDDGGRPSSKIITVDIEGGYVDIKKDFLIFADKACVRK